MASKSAVIKNRASTAKDAAAAKKANLIVGSAEMVGFSTATAPLMNGEIKKQDHKSACMSEASGEVSRTTACSLFSQTEPTSTSSSISFSSVSLNSSDNTTKDSANVPASLTENPTVDHGSDTYTSEMHRKKTKKKQCDSGVASSEKQTGLDTRVDQDTISYNHKQHLRAFIVEATLQQHPKESNGTATMESKKGEQQNRCDILTLPGTPPQKDAISLIQSSRLLSKLPYPTHKYNVEASNSPVAPRPVHRRDRNPVARFELHALTPRIVQTYKKDFLRFAESGNEISFLDQNTIQPRHQRKPFVAIIEPDDDFYIVNRLCEKDTTCLEQETAPKDHPWEESSEWMVRNTIQCLLGDKNIEMSYVSILSTINVLQSKYDQDPNRVVTLSRTDLSVRGEDEGMDRIEATATEAAVAERRVGKMYSKLLRIMMRCNVAEALAQEATRQRNINPTALYLQLYNAIQNAGYELQDTDHLQICQFLLEKQSAEEALLCLSKINPARWIDATYRTAISCHLFSNPRHLHEAEVILDQYLTHTNTPAVSLAKNDQEREKANKVMIQEWFKLQLDASKWEEIKTLYEGRRARLVEAPSNIDRLTASELRSYCADTERNYLAGQQRPSRRASTASLISVASSGAFSAPSIGATTSQTLPQFPESTTAAPITTSQSFSFFSAFSSTRRHSTASTASYTFDATAPPTVKVKQVPPPRLSLQSNSSTSSSQVSRYLTILDNGMLEECINHKQFDYGWSQIYERMGPTLEDKDTAKIVMRLCKRAFLGHGGLGLKLPGSPNILAKDFCSGDDDDDDIELDDGCSNQRTDMGLFRDKDMTKSNSKQEDPEIWEARAWVIYNKATMNPFFFSSNNASSPRSPSQLQNPSSTAASVSNSGVSASSGAIPLTSSISAPIVAGTTSLTVFLHNILIVAINSPEKSSRFLKACRIYNQMRNDPLTQYQAQLRDPFVMKYMIKAIYDTVIAIVRAQNQEQEHERIEPSHLSQSMTIGRLIDLTFEIYADMRNVGPIRQLPHLSTLAPSTSAPLKPHRTVSVPNIASSSASIGGSMSMFFQLSSRPLIASSATVDLSGCGANTLPTHSVSAISPSTNITSHAAMNSPSSRSKIPTTTTNAPCVLQPLNPTLSPITRARRLPNELYLALLHLCIQVPLSGIQQSARVVKTIITDMMSTKSGQQPANLDRHLAAALQYYHDQWMCRPHELKERRNGNRDEEDAKKENPSACVFHGWMYCPEEYILSHMTTSKDSIPCESIYDLSGPDATIYAADVSSIPPDSMVSSAPSCTARGSTANLQDIERSDYYSISKHDADLDELDQYLGERAAAAIKSNDPNSHSAEANAHWMDGLDHDTCNDRFYWNLWSREHPLLQEIKFSRRRARMLWRHVSYVEKL
ncbi:hypothetical protein BC939DRAFT_500218 [Gamsiella multidivaricata]|uniref:uncharacterized protein n=1 Tax=Gamsiella multidivaricata TaxID=101098 RepID=UPI002220126C|nr:uncharacterized protein BC939DRAFT_500218 [Gamsiella multidivaricata]KAG0369731.1 hypothetical protein BGZ54_009078 [Gamsiella multidivaricata]KAI7829368.1 hypothetical protein BC939DRAFT_500218 [Gamsiella multidivaricata]